MLAANLFKNITYSFERFLEPIGAYSSPTSGILHSTVSVKNFFMADRIDWYCFYDRSQNTVLFVDTGNPIITGSDFLDKTLASLNSSWQSTDIFLTHFHVDHAGNLAYCLDKGAKSAYFIAPDTYDDSLVSSFFMWTHSSDVVRGDTDAIQHLELLLGKTYFDGVDPSKCHLVEKGNSFDIANYHLEVVPTPGHAPEHACLIDVDHKLLVAGDHLIFAKPGMMQLQPDQRLMYHYVESFKELSHHTFNLVLMSHHEPMTDSEEIQDFIKHTWKSYENFLPTMKDRVLSLGQVGIYDFANALAARHPQGLNSFDPSLQVRRLTLAFGTLEGLHDYGLVERRQDDDGSFVYFVQRRR